MNNNNNNEEKNTVKTSGKAIASLILSIVGIFLIAIPSIIGIILGHIARSEIKKSNGLIEGKGLALAGLIIGYITVGIIVIGMLAAIIVPKLVGNGNQLKEQLTCVQMKGIDNSLQIFKMDNGIYPETEEGLAILVHTIPKDSWGNDFSYTKTANGFEITSFGLDRVNSEDDIKYSTCQ